MAGRLSTTVRVGGRASKTFTETLKGRGVETQPRSTIGRTIADLLVAEAVDRDYRRFENERKVMVSSIQHAANIEMRRLIDFVTSQLIGLPSPVITLANRDTARKEGFTPGAISWKSGMLMHGMKTANWRPVFPISGAVEWAALSRSYIAQKGNRAFFQNTGQLKAQLRAMRSSYPQSLGGVKVSAKDLSRQSEKTLIRAATDGVRRKVILASIDIQIFPNARPNHFPGLLTGRWDQVDLYAGLEASSFIPSSLREKLSGPRKNRFPYRFRPMLGPVTQFWALHRIPAAISIAIRNSNRIRQRVS